MQQFTLTSLLGLAAVATSLAIPAQPLPKRDSISITPHDMYSSSIGVLGCKINTNRVAYFPSMPQCDGMCIKVSANGRSLNLLHIDTSGGAYDISYDAWNILSTGKSATEDPTMGGGIPATVESAPMSDCAHLLKTDNGKLGLSAPNAVGFFASCGASSWVGKNAALFNIQDPACTLGVDEVCTLDMSVSNQPQCPNSILGSKAALNGEDVYNIIYPTGEKQLAAN